MQEVIKNTLRRTRLFSRATDEMLDFVARAVEVVKIRQGDVVFRKGDAGGALYVVQQGRVSIEDNGLVLNHLEAGQLFGEMAALDHEVRSATVAAEEDSILLKVERRTLDDLLSSFPGASTATIGSLCSSLRARVQDVSNVSTHMKLLEHELEIGRQIQSCFVPKTLPRVPGWELAAYFRAARECAGDFYDAFPLPRYDRVALIIGDVCDKGVGSALFMTLFRSLLRALANLEHFVDGHDPSGGTPPGDPAEQILKSVNLTNNYVALTHGDTSMFASLFFGLLDPVSGSLLYANCGHEGPIVAAGGTVRAALETTGPVVGLFPNASFGIREFRLQHDDMLLAFTDGVTEAVNRAGEQFGYERLHALVALPERRPGELLQAIQQQVDEFAAGTPQSDDITMLAVKRAAVV